MQAVILAGGFGTRLSHVVKDVPKPMAPIADVPFLDYLYHQLSDQGFDDFIMLTGYKAEVIENYFSRFNNVRFIHEDHPLGTGGALLNAYEHLDHQFLLLNGDTFFDADFSLLLKYKKEQIKAPTILMALRYSEDLSRYGFVSIDREYNVQAFIEKGQLPENQIDGYINAGTYLIDKAILTRYYDQFHDQQISLETELFPQFIADHLFKAIPLGGFFIDIGIPEDYKRAQTLIPRAIKQQKKPTLFIDKDGTLIEDHGYVHGKNIEPIASTIQIVKDYYDKGYQLVMITNQAGVAKGKFIEKEMHENIEATLNFYKSQNLCFDHVEYCTYCEEATIELYKKKSYARKPEPGMILRACEVLPIDLSRSVMIGDNAKVDHILLPYLRSIIIEK